MYSKSMLLNNYGVFLLEKMKKGGLVFVKEKSSIVEETLKNAIIESEGSLLNTKMKEEQLTKEKIEKIKNYIFSPSEIFKVEDMSIAQK